MFANANVLNNIKETEAEAAERSTHNILVFDPKMSVEHELSPRCHRCPVAAPSAMLSLLPAAGNAVAVAVAALSSLPSLLTFM